MITANYPGDSADSASSGTTSLTVNAGTTTTSALVLDGSGQCHAPLTGASCSVTLSTSSSPDVIYCTTTQYYVNTGVSLSNTAGLTFNPRYSVSANQIIQKGWYAIANTRLSGAQITDAETGSSSTDDAAMICLGISGANINSPFDPNVSLAASETQSQGNGVTFSTTNSNDFLIVVGGDDHAMHGISANSGWSLVGDINQGLPDYPYDLAVEYRVVSSTQTNLNVFFDTFNSDTASRVNIADAIVVAGSSATPKLGLDGSGQCHAPASGNSCTITISTSNANDVCVAVATYYYTDTPTAPTDTGGHTFTQRLSNTAGHILTKEFYFIASTALNSDVVTFKSSSLDDISAIVLCVSGASTNSPFDPNGALPAVQNQASGTAVTFSTSHANDFLIVIGSDSNANHPMSANNGWTLVQDVSAGSPDYPFDLGTECQIVNSTQSGVSVYFDQFNSVTNSRVNIVDSIQSP